MSSASATRLRIPLDRRWVRSPGLNDGFTGFAGPFGPCIGKGSDAMWLDRGRAEQCGHQGWYTNYSSVSSGRGIRNIKAASLKDSPLACDAGVTREYSTV